MKIAVIKDDELFEGSIPEVANFIKRTPETIRRWKREGKKKVFDNVSGCVVYLKINKL